ncbi:MAG TPA: hypothetical protein VIK99_02810 [Thermaerobacter sp.]
MGSNTARIHRWHLWLERLPERAVRGAAAAAGLLAVVLLALLLWALETVHAVWLRAPLVLVTATALGLAGLALGAVLYELRRRRS